MRKIFLKALVNIFLNDMGFLGGIVVYKNKEKIIKYFNVEIKLLIVLLKSEHPD